MGNSFLAPFVATLYFFKAGTALVLGFLGMLNFSLIQSPDEDFFAEFKNNLSAAFILLVRNSVVMSGLVYFFLHTLNFFSVLIFRATSLGAAGLFATGWCCGDADVDAQFDFATTFLRLSP